MRYSERRAVMQAAALEAASLSFQHRIAVGIVTRRRSHCCWSHMSATKRRTMPTNNQSRRNPATNAVRQQCHSS